MINENMIIISASIIIGACIISGHVVDLIMIVVTIFAIWGICVAFRSL